MHLPDVLDATKDAYWGGEDALAGGYPPEVVRIGGRRVVELPVPL